MNRRRIAIMATVAGMTIALAFAGIAKPSARIAYNRTTSMPLGFYRLEPFVQAQRGMLVMTRLPADAATIAAQRRYLPASVPALKRVAAMTGSTVCRHGLRVTIDGQDSVRALDRDRMGRGLPVWQGCRQLRQGQVFLLSGTDPAAFDGRYFGPVSTALIIAEARALWTW
jgi:conjugative transfer signal peptidase TraF